VTLISFMLLLFHMHRPSKLRCIITAKEAKEDVLRSVKTVSASISAMGGAVNFQLVTAVKGFWKSTRRWPTIVIGMLRS